MEFIGLIILLLLIPRIVNYKMKKEYNRSDYKNESGNTYKEVFDDKGKYGEYLIFKTLEDMNKNYKMLTNIYLPKGNGETTEIDLIYIHETGIYVIESKNYSGWIFGDEKNRYWTQTLKSGKKERFYNPIMQNKTHINYLQKVLNIDEQYIKSIIVFSKRCTLKKVEVNSKDIKVINRDDLKIVIEDLIYNRPKIFEMGKIIKLYYELKPYTCATDDEKLKHIDNINEKYSDTDNKETSDELNFKESNLLNKEKIKECKNIDENSDFYKDLKEYRLIKSKEEKVKPYFIYSNEGIKEIIKAKPKTLDDIKIIPGFGKVKCEKYGEDILEIVRRNNRN